MREKIKEYLKNNNKILKKFIKIKISLKYARYKYENNQISKKEYLKLVDKIMNCLNKTLTNIEENEKIYNSILRDL